MAYFDIEERAGAWYAWKDLIQRPGFSKTLNCEEKRRVLEEQLRPSGLQPLVLVDHSGIEIVPGSKKFLKMERRYNCVMSKRAKEYIDFCNSLD